MLLFYNAFSLGHLATYHKGSEDNKGKRLKHGILLLFFFYPKKKKIKQHMLSTSYVFALGSHFGYIQKYLDEFWPNWKDTKIVISYVFKQIPAYCLNAE